MKRRERRSEERRQRREKVRREERDKKRRDERRREKRTEPRTLEEPAGSTLQLLFRPVLKKRAQSRCHRHSEAQCLGGQNDVEGVSTHKVKHIVVHVKSQGF